MKKWEVLKSDYLYKTPYGNLRRDRCLLGNGEVIDKYPVNECADWVNAVVITKEKKVILVRQYRHGCNAFFYEIPAGSVKKQENYAEAIKREVLEETGYKTEKPPICLGEFHVNPAIQNNRIISYLLTDAVKVADQDLDDTELVEVYAYELEAIKKMIENKEITQMFSVFALQLAIRE